MKFTALSTLAVLYRATAADALTISPNVGEFFDNIDANHDGTLTGLEIYHKFSERYADRVARTSKAINENEQEHDGHFVLPTESLDAIVQALDSNNDGIVTLVDFAKELGGPFTANETVQQIHVSLTGVETGLLLHCRIEWLSGVTLMQLMHLIGALFFFLTLGTSVQK